MTYSCVQIVYGIDLTPDQDGNPFAPFDELVDELRDAGVVEGAYNGIGDTPYWVGADLGYADPSTTRTEGMRMAPTPEDEADFAAKRDALLSHLDGLGTDEAADMAKVVRGQRPVVFLAWSSS